MAPLPTLLTAALSLASTSQFTNPTSSWQQQPTTTGSSITPSTLASQVRQQQVVSTVMTILPTTAAASTLPSSSPTAWSAVRRTMKHTLALRQDNTTCSAGFVPCTNPGGIVCVGDNQYGLCAANNCALLQNIIPGVNCTIYSNIIGAAANVTHTNVTQSNNTQTDDTQPSSANSTLPTALVVLNHTLATRPIQPRVQAAADPSIIPTPPSTPSSASSAVDYKQYTGDGTNWPSTSDWVSSFDDMWNSNLQNLTSKVCGQYGPNSDSESSTLKSAIQSAASDSKLDPRFILALVMQESHGCVRVEATMGAHSNPGLLQDYDGASNCNVGGQMKTPCPDDEIKGMINDGVFGNTAPGNAKGEGLMQDYDAASSKSPVSDAARYYITARIYNSGSYVNNDLGCGVATHCYATDVANRLRGWTGAESPCVVDEVTANCGSKPNTTSSPAPASSTGAASGSSTASSSASPSGTGSSAAGQFMASMGSPYSVGLISMFANVFKSSN